MIRTLARRERPYGTTLAELLALIERRQDDILCISAVCFFTRADDLLTSLAQTVEQIQELMRPKEVMTRRIASISRRDSAARGGFDSPVIRQQALLGCPVPRLTLLFFGAAEDVPEAAKMVTAGTARLHFVPQANGQTGRCFQTALRPRMKCSTKDTTATINRR